MDNLEHNTQKDHVLGIFNEEILAEVKARLSDKEFIALMGKAIDHSIKAEAALSYDFNTAINAISEKFRGEIRVSVSDVYQTLRDLGIVDYSGADFKYIEEILKGFGLLVVPDDQMEK
jgi:hypothetical protein